MLQSAVVQLYCLIRRVHQHHLAHKTDFFTWTKTKYIFRNWLKTALSFFASHLLLGPHLDPILLIKVSWAEEDATAVHIQSLRGDKAFSYNTNSHEYMCFFPLSILTSTYLAELGLVKWRQVVFRYHDDSTLVAVLPQRFSTNKGGRAWKSHVDM